MPTYRDDPSRRKADGCAPICGADIGEMLFYLPRPLRAATLDPALEILLPHRMPNERRLMRGFLKYFHLLSVGFLISQRTSEDAALFERNLRVLEDRYRLPPPAVSRVNELLDAIDRMLEQAARQLPSSCARRQTCARLMMLERLSL
jgi:hypothetical protein